MIGGHCSCDEAQSARRFYRSRGFIDSPIKPVTQCLMLAMVHQALREP